MTPTLWLEEIINNFLPLVKENLEIFINSSLVHKSLHIDYFPFIKFFYFTFQKQAPSSLIDPYSYIFP